MPSAFAAASRRQPWRSSASMIICRSGCVSATLSEHAAGPTATGSVSDAPRPPPSVGRSATPTREPRPRNTARSTACSSSRTLPGQSCARSAARAAGVKPSTSRQALAEAERRKCSAKSGMSAVRSRSAGISIVTTLIRQNKSARNRPVATRLARSSLAARITRASTACVLLPPTASNCIDCSTRRSFTCSAGDAVAISSRKIVPPSAWRNFPGRSATAPVNAPATWPKSSLSSSVSERLPQATSTNRPVRPLRRWISRASSDLPVPVSPVTSTLTGVVATRSTRSVIRWTAGCVPSRVSDGGGATRDDAGTGGISGSDNCHLFPRSQNGDGKVAVGRQVTGIDTPCPSRPSQPVGQASACLSLPRLAEAGSGLPRTISPDAHCAHPGLHSLGCACAPASCLRWSHTPSQW